MNHIRLSIRIEIKFKVTSTPNLQFYNILIKITYNLLIICSFVENIIYAYITEKIICLRKYLAPAVGI